MSASALGPDGTASGIEDRLGHSCDTLDEEFSGYAALRSCLTVGVDTRLDVLVAASHVGLVEHVAELFGRDIHSLGSLLSLVDRFGVGFGCFLRNIFAVCVSGFREILRGGGVGGFGESFSVINHGGIDF